MQQAQQAQQKSLLMQRDASAHHDDSPEAEVQKVVSRDIGAMLLLQGRPGQGAMAVPCGCYFIQCWLHREAQELSCVMEVFHGNEGTCTPYASVLHLVRWLAST